MKKTHLVIHHSLVSYNGKNQFNGINNYHQRQGFPKSQLGYYVGYQYLIEGNGKVIQARNDEETGAHCKQKLMNYRSIGICLTGNFDKEEPTQEQIVSLASLIETLQEKHGIQDKNIKLHREYATYKSCPGTNIPNDIIGYIEGRLNLNKVSEWAQYAVDRATEKGYATEWHTPQEIVGNSVLENVLFKMGFLHKREGNVSKERLMVALDKAGLL